MASFTLSAAPTYPDGTTVKAYPESNWPNSQVKTDAAPLGTETDSQSVSGGTATFTGLTAGARYVAYALVNSQHRYASFVAGEDISDASAIVRQGDTGVVGSTEITDGSVALTDLSGSARADWEYAYSGYKTIVRGASYQGNNLATGTYVMLPGSGWIVSAGNLSALGVFPFDPAHYAAGSRSVKLKLVGQLWVNSVAPGASTTFRPGLYPVTNSASALVAATLGTVVTGSQPSVVSAPAAGSSTAFDSGDFAAPVSGQFAVGLVLGGAAMAAGSYMTVVYSLLARQV